MEGFEKLLVGLSDNEADVELIRYARRLGEIGCVQDVHFLHVRSENGSGDAASEVQARLETRMGAHDLQPAGVHVVDEPLLDRLLERIADEKFDAVLIGHRKIRSGRRSLARRLAMQAPCSVWMVPENSTAPAPGPSRVLVPIDFSEHAADALRVATALAARAGLEECTALYVHFNPAVVSFEEYECIKRGEEQQAFERFIEPIDCHGVRVKLLFEEGPRAAETILRIAEERRADLIVMGTRGRTRSSAVLLGSEAEQTLIGAKVPILVVKHAGARLTLLEALLDKQFLKRGLRFG